MPSKQKKVYVVGAGLAGSECAYQLAQKGYQVQLIEMRGKKSTPAHKTDLFAELVCSNSFGSMTDYSAPGQLKREASLLGSMILDAAQKAHVPSGMALGVDRQVFSEEVTSRLRHHPNISIETRCVESIDEIPRPAVIATGPLTDESLAQSILEHFNNEFLYFFDAIAPIVDTDSINMNIAWKADRWGNLVYRMTARNFNPMMAMAGRVTIAEVEELVEPGELDADQIHTPGIYVQRILLGSGYEKPIEQRTVRPATATKGGA